MVKRLDPAAEGGSKRDKRKEMVEVLLPDPPRVRRNDPKIVEAGMGSARKAAIEAARKLMKLSRKRNLKQKGAQKKADKPTHVDRLVEAQEYRAGTASVGRMAGGRHANVRGPNAPIVKTKKGPNYKAKKSAKDARERAGRPMSKEAKALRDFERSLTDDDKALMELAEMFSK